MKFAQNSNTVFDRATADYHVSDHVDAPHPNPYDEREQSTIPYMPKT